MLCLMYLTLIHCVLHTEAVTGKLISIPKDHEYPYVVSIGVKNATNLPYENQYCTGVLISNQSVLTSAHCFDGYMSSETEVILGSIDLSRGRRFNVEGWITFDEWAAVNNRRPNNADNDIAILVLSMPIDYPQIRPVKLSTLNKLQFERTQGIILGFGLINDVFRSRLLIAGKVNILSTRECRERIRKYANCRYKIKGPEFCSASKPYILTGCGDSGGPILNMRRELVGINLGICPTRQASWYKLRGFSVEEFLKGHQSNFHLSIDYYRDFINDFR